MDPTTIVQALINGTLLGGIYALLASGLSLYFGVARVANSAHAAFAILASFVSYWLYTLFGVDPFLSFPVVTIVFFTMGIVLQRTIIARVMDSPPMMRLTLTFFLAIAVENAMVLCWKNIYRSIVTPYTMVSFSIGAFSVPFIRFVAFIASIITETFLLILIKFTKTGKAIRATADNKNAAQLCGININFIYMVTAGISFALAGIGGVLLALLFTIYPSAHLLWIGKLYTIVIIGGMGSLAGSVLCSFLIGFLDAFAGIFGSILLGSVISWILLLLTLLIRPRGLLGK